MKKLPMKNDMGESLNITINPYTKHALIHIDKCFFHVSKEEEIDTIVDILKKFKEEAYGDKSN